MAIGPHSHIATQPRGNIATSPHSYIAATGSTKGAAEGRPPLVGAAGGRLPLWLCSYEAMWLCGYVAMWLCGHVAMWLCGQVEIILELFWHHVGIIFGSCGNHFGKFPKVLGHYCEQGLGMIAWDHFEGGLAHLVPLHILLLFPNQNNHEHLYLHFVYHRFSRKRINS